MATFYKLFIAFLAITAIGNLYFGFQIINSLSAFLGLFNAIAMFACIYINK